VGRYSQITFNQDKLKAQQQFDALKRTARAEKIKEYTLSVLFCVCLAVCLWFGLLLF